MKSRVIRSIAGFLLAISLILSAFFAYVWQRDEYVLKHMQFGPQMFYSNQISLMSHLFFIGIVISILLVIALAVAFIKSQRHTVGQLKKGGSAVKNRRRYVIGGLATILVLIFYYVIDYAVVANNVRSHVKSALSTTIQSVGQLTPAQFKSLVPAGVTQDRLFMNMDNRWLVVNPYSVFVKERIEYLTWSELNQVSSSPICLMNIVSMSLVPGNTSMMVTTDVRFVGPFGIPRTISVIELQ